MTDRLPELLDEPTTVYIARKGRTVLYVGITGRNLKRMHAHARASEWWRRASRIDLRHLPTRTEALQLERDLIGEWSPPYNVLHNHDGDDPEPGPDLLDADDLFALIPSRRAVRILMRDVPTVTVGRRQYVTKADYFAYLEAHTVHREAT